MYEYDNKTNDMAKVDIVGYGYGYGKRDGYCSPQDSYYNYGFASHTLNNNKNDVAS